MLYFIPSGPAGTTIQDQIKSLGLEYALDAGRLAVGKNPRGPDGQGGHIVARSGTWAADHCGYFPDRQTWHKSKRLGEVWLGLFNGREYKPSEFARPTLLPGRGVTLEDGQVWTVPVARRWLEHDGEPVYMPALPCRAKMNDTGVWVEGDVKPQYRTLWDLAMGYHDCIAEAYADTEEGQTSIEFDYPVDDLAIGAITANYYISHDEADVLGLYSADAQTQIIDVTLDSKSLQDILKKNVLAESSSS